MTSWLRSWTRPGPRAYWRCRRWPSWRAGKSADRLFLVVYGGPFGIDAAAHRGALGADGVTVALLAGGLSYGYPHGHHELFAAVVGQGW